MEIDGSSHFATMTNFQKSKIKIAYFCLAVLVSIILIFSGHYSYALGTDASVSSDASKTILPSRFLLADASGSEETEIKAIQIRDNAYMLTGEGGNIGLLATKDQNLMIDSQFPQMTDKIVAAINQINPAPIKNEQWEDGPINSEQLLTLTYQALTLQN